MADIEIIYREGYCEMMKSDDFCEQCHTDMASNTECSMFNEGKQEKNVIPSGDCIYAKFKYIHKWMGVKNYELEEFQDSFNPHLNCMMLKTRNKIYECEKVILDRKCIYNEYDDEITLSSNDSKKLEGKS